MVTGKKCNVTYLEKSRILKKLCDSVSKTCIYYKGKSYVKSLRQRQLQRRTTDKF